MAHCPRCRKDHDIDPFFEQQVWPAIEAYARAVAHNHADRADCTYVDSGLRRMLQIQWGQLVSKDAECVAKRPYPTIEVAREVAKDISERIGEKISAYKCGWCDFWHVGHENKPKSKKKGQKWWQQADAVIRPPVKRGGGE